MVYVMEWPSILASTSYWFAQKCNFQIERYDEQLAVVAAFNEWNSWYILQFEWKNTSTPGNITDVQNMKAVK